jgi:hypothetical protein
MSNWGVVISQSRSGLIVRVDGGFLVPGRNERPRDAAVGVRFHGRGPGRAGAFLLPDAVSAGSRLARAGLGLEPGHLRDAGDGLLGDCGMPSRIVAARHVPAVVLVADLEPNVGCHGACPHHLQDQAADYPGCARPKRAGHSPALDWGHDLSLPQPQPRFRFLQQTARRQDSKLSPRTPRARESARGLTASGVRRKIHIDSNVARTWGWITMRRLAVIVLLGTVLATLGGALTASPALARGPKWELQESNSFTLSAAYCGFRVGLTWPVGRQYAKLLKAPDGSMITLITGALVATYTNLETGKTITENESGPAKFTESPDGSATAATTGHTGIFLEPTDARRFGLPPVSVTAGALTESYASNGNLTSVSLRGHVLVDVCAALS